MLIVISNCILEKGDYIMARTSKKTVYKRIEDKLQNIRETEELLTQLKEELQTLYLEKDELEMRALLDAMKAKGLNINEALAKFGDNEAPKLSRAKNKKIEKEIIENTTEQL